MGLAEYLEDRRTRVDEAIEASIPPRHPDPARLVEAMRYTLLLPGKRIRAIVCLAVAELFGGSEADVMPLAVAAEMVHAASLILDDLPAFDNAQRRRGSLTNHLAYGESTAMLAAVGLLNAAYGHLARASRRRWIGPDDGIGSAIALSEAVGENGMVAGEGLDLLARDETPGLEDLEQIHAMKTGSLFIACTVEAGRLAGAGSNESTALRAYSKNLGLAFQIIDDVLDAVGDPEKTGKDTGQDEGGANFVTFAGVDGARQLSAELIETAVLSLSTFGSRARRLEEIARYVGGRDR